MRTLLTIAGFDPSSGAGITADLMVFAAHGFFGTSCITTLTVQSTQSVRAVYPVDAETIADTLACLEDDLPTSGVKIGMLGTKKTVDVVAAFLAVLRQNEGIEGATTRARVPVVVDPVLRASAGRELLEPGGAYALRARLLPLADWVTPNLDELGWLTGALVNDREGMLRAALQLQQEIAGAAVANGRRIHVLAKGGHLTVPGSADPGPPDDLLLTAEGERHWLQGERVVTTSTHGTGCALSSALLCCLALGDPPLAAAQNAKAYVTEALRRAVPIGHGPGPVEHLWPLRAVPMK
jgi:hydroxymethylpyrimidine/phosphomethylpyrimidine kinase